MIKCFVGDDTHNKKQKITEGMIPMTKNITVIDENGNILDRTYPKRANGLVKKGRARWDGDAVIRLCPSRNREEVKMANNIYEVLDNQISKMQDQLKDVSEEAAMPVRIQILKTFEQFKIQEQKSKLADMIGTQLETLQESMKNDDMFTPENAASRELTRQKMIELMEKLVDEKDNTENNLK